MKEERNVLGDALAACSLSPRAGFFRDGCCRTGEEDVGRHVVCAELTREFLEFSKSKGNDLATPVPEIGFPPRLRPGDRWCLCVFRWKEALEAGAAPRILMTATHEAALEHVAIDDLKRHAIDLN